MIRKGISAAGRMLRVRHYVKNILVLLPLVFNGSLFDTETLPSALWGFGAFCLLSSAVYIVNDIRDAENDRRHPVKRGRAIASGAVPVGTAAALAGNLVVLAAAAQFLARRDDPLSWLWPGLYLLLNLAYSFGLKDIPVADVAALAAGFLLRLLYGSAVTGIAISNWLCLTVIALSFYLGLGKRRSELVANPGGATRGVLRRYTYGFLDKNMALCMTLALVFYSLWSVDTATVERLGGNMVWTVPLALIICLRYNLVTEGQGDGDPVEALFRDKALLCLAILFGLLTVGIIYGGLL
ncbi:MAG: decaprenyl-phosphate phosphoribosyltransferase [Oscillospiraceae bacterium]|jgi:4-hydroxybenzoate polyprenyltransferase|nr:decaprenyl-phosphate phosphoribosyltransferase [Oscillospiraceae bacterium]